MTNWNRTLDIKDEWIKAKNEEENYLPVLAETIALKLFKLTPFGTNYWEIDTETERLIRSFTRLSNKKTVTFDEFNSLMEELYNWGDIELDKNEKVCFIKTF